MMTQRPLKNNSINGSLTRRIFLIAFVFLVIPLLFHTVFMYRMNYRDKVVENLAELNLLSDEKRDTIEYYVQIEKKLLQSIGNLSLSNEILQDFADGKTLLYLKKNQKGDYICALSSNKTLIGQNYTTLVAEQGHALFQKQDLYLFEMIERGEAVLVEKIPAVDLLQNFRGEEVFLLTDEGEIIASTIPHLEEQTLKYEETFRLAGKNYLAVNALLFEGKVSLLTAFPEEKYTLHFGDYLFEASYLFLFILIIGGLCVLYLTMQMAKPLKRLANVMRTVGEGEIHQEYQPSAFGFEINHLGRVFNEMRQGLIRNIELEKELQLGREVQKSLLPKEHLESKALDIATQFIPAKEVGGDFFDLYRVEDRMLCVMADGSGKGVYACLYSLGMRTTLRSLFAQGLSLDDLVREANRLFMEDTQDSGAFVTAWIGILDLNTHELIYTNAGHQEGLFLSQAGEISSLTTEGIALGVMPLEEVETQNLLMKDGDTLLLYTDGVVEAHDPENQLFGKKRLIEVIKKEGRHSAEELSDSIVREVRSFSNGKELYDDLTLLILRL